MHHAIVHAEQFADERGKAGSSNKSPPTLNENSRGDLEKDGREEARRGMNTLSSSHRWQAFVLRHYDFADPTK